MATLKALRLRIGSVKSSEKITGAMKMISSAKVHKNEMELKKLVPFRSQVKSIMAHLLATDVDFNSPLITEREVKKVGIVVFGSDDGLCGAYNINIFKRLLMELNSVKEKHGSSVEITVIPVGKKMVKAVRKIEGGHIKVDVIPDIDSKMSGKTVNEFGHVLRERFLAGEMDLIEVVYMNFISRSRQRPHSEQLFPVSHQAIENEAQGVADENKLYIFEPDPNTIFNDVLPMFVLSTLQEITIENRASEMAARVMAMQSANDNAKKLLESLQIEFNKLRQEGITTELLDILGGQTEK